MVVVVGKRGKIWRVMGERSIADFVMVKSAIYVITVSEIDRVFAVISWVPKGAILALLATTTWLSAISNKFEAGLRVKMGAISFFFPLVPNLQMPLSK